MTSPRNATVKTFGLQNQQLALGFYEDNETRQEAEKRLVFHANLQLLAAGLPAACGQEDSGLQDIAESLLVNYREKSRLLQESPTAVDRRIEKFLERYFDSLKLEQPLQLPDQMVTLDRHGLGRVLSLPADGDEYRNELVSSYRVKNGVLHNPKHDRRTTKGTFHVTEGGLPIADDKLVVPKHVFAKLFQIAMNPPAEYLELPFTSQCETKASTFVSLFLRPIVSPEITGVSPHKSMEIRFFAPGSLVSNLDFVESIFGNAGDPLIPDNDAALDVKHWTGHTGAVILAPQMLNFTKKELGLPHWDQATSRQQRDSMCWKEKNEIYNDGLPFKITCRDESGVIITLIADNYFGYCKKEVKTQLSFSANLFGNAEEEHAGGAIAFRSYNLGDKFQADHSEDNGLNFDDVIKLSQGAIKVHPEGHGSDAVFPDLIYLPENAEAVLREQRIRWVRNSESQEIPLLPGKVYMSPSGYQIRMEKHPSAPSWRLIGTSSEGTFCHKPCTVSGGGKSEISKSLVDYMHYGPLFVSNLEDDFARIEKIIQKDDYHLRWRKGYKNSPDYSSKPKSRPIFGWQRSLGSVIKLLNPSAEYNDEYNDWLESIPGYLLSMLFIIKRFEEENWDENWQQLFGVDIVNGEPGHELKYRERQLVGTYLRVGFIGPRKWRTFKLRQDFSASVKIQTEDDISASRVIPAAQVSHLTDSENKGSLKFVINCEYRLFQRPDEAIHRGFDKQAEADLAGPANFISNFEPLTKNDVKRMAEYVADFDAFSLPMQNLLRSMLADEQSQYVACSANPRKVNGKPSKNPRYLQARPDIVSPFTRYVSERAMRLSRKIPFNQPLNIPVHSVLMGRRNNPPDKKAGIPSLAVYNPIHYQELPELFMDFICSLTGKSPSTTGFGSEGALTKGPFNAIQSAADLNAALVSYLLTDLKVFSTSAGHIGPNVQVDHDISLLVPEIWCRLESHERDPDYLIKEGSLEKLEDREFEGKPVSVSRLGYRITQKFIRNYFGRVFDHPLSVFDDQMLKPETQDEAAFYEGIQYICAAHKKVALRYLEDGTYEDLCPPLQSLVNIMANGNDNGRDISHPEIRQMFTKDNLLQSDWYHQRLIAKHDADLELMQKHLAYIDHWESLPNSEQEAERLGLCERREWVEKQIRQMQSNDYLNQLTGTIGLQPSNRDSISST